MAMIDRDTLARLCDARDTLCGFCENTACDKCQVTMLINDALSEAEEDESAEDRKTDL